MAGCFYLKKHYWKLVAVKLQKLRNKYESFVVCWYGRGQMPRHLGYFMWRWCKMCCSLRQICGCCCTVKLNTSRVFIIKHLEEYPLGCLGDIVIPSRCAPWLGGILKVMEQALSHITLPSNRILCCKTSQLGQFMLPLWRRRVFQAHHKSCVGWRSLVSNFGIWMG